MSTAQAAIGGALPRVDGPAKVTGGAHYAADIALPGLAHACLVTSAIARGRIASIATAAARALPGVLLVLTHENASTAVAEAKSVAQRGPLSFSKAPLASDEIFFAGQIVAVVVADTFEAARDAAARLEIRYASEPATASLDDPGSTVIPAQALGEAELDQGDADAAWKGGAVRLYERYETPAQHHNPMELFQTTCAWDGDELTVWESTQNPRAVQHGLAQQLGMDPERIRVRSPYVGGAFGSRGQLGHYTALVAHAARELGRPVKLVASRPQGFTLRTFRAETRHDVKLAAARDGRLQALVHESWELTSRVDHFALAGSDDTSRLYACPAVRTQVHNVLADRQMPGFMRAPPELPYLFALESALDELAHELQLDPVELRRINDTRTDPVSGKPYTSRSLMPCFDAAAHAFGWSGRPHRPGSRRDGDSWVGYGCASALYPAKIGAAECRITLLAADRARVEIGSQEIGNGAYTILTQVACEGLGLQPHQVEVVLGDSRLPAAPITAGSNSAASTCNAVAQACAEVRAKLRAQPAFPLVVDIAHQPPDIDGADSGLAQVRRGASVLGGGVMPHDLRFAFGAQFVEVRVHAASGEIRVPRIVGAFACGRIVNPRTARSQLMAGQIWGAASALLEATEIDHRDARYVNTDLAEYHVAVNADIGEVTPLLVPDEDTRVNPLGIKGAGEIGATGMNAAVANAVFNATGVRVRRLPIRVGDLLGQGVLA